MIGKSLDIAGLGFSICAAISNGRVSKGCAVTSIAIDLYQNDPCGAELGVFSMLPFKKNSPLELYFDIADISYGINAIGANGKPICKDRINWNALTLEGKDESFLEENKNYELGNHLMGFGEKFEK